MLGIPNIDVAQVTIVVPLFVTIACLLTILRLADRIHTRRFGWDDSFAILSMVAMLLTTLFCFLYLAPTSSQLGVIAYYGADLCFLATVWSARISITFSVVRIVVHPQHRRWLYLQAGLFMAMYLLLIAQEFWTCEPEPGWKTIQNPRPQCNLGLAVAITQIVFDVFADILITIVPLWIFWRSKLERSVRLRFILLFSSTLFITIVSLVHDILVFQTGGLDEAFAAMMEDSIALIVCNLTVIVTTCIRLFSKRREDMDVDAPNQKRSGDSTPRVFLLKFLGFGRMGGGSRRAEEGLETALTTIPKSSFLDLRPSRDDLSDATSYLEVKDPRDVEEGAPFTGQLKAPVVPPKQGKGIWLERQVQVVPDGDVDKA